MVIASVAACFILPKFSVFPSEFFLPMCVALAIISLGMLGLTLKQKGALATMLNLVLSVVLLISCFMIPTLEKRQNTAFTEPAFTAVRNVNFYVMDSEYRSNHSNTFDTAEVSDNLEQYQYARFIIQKELNQEDQAKALEDLQNQLGTANVNYVTVDTVSDAIKALYHNDGDVLVLNQAFESTIKTIRAYSKFDTDTKVLYTTTLNDNEQEEIVVTDTNYLQPFVVYVAAHDESTTSYSLYGRTDVDMIMAINPNNKQILMVSIPRDFYVENPALGNGLDKLTHLGNNGIYNTLDGINQTFGLNINEYLLTDFDHFANLVDSIGGISLYNPYEFSSLHTGYYYPEGDLTLDGQHALYYARERKTLANGDYARNEHQGIAMQALLTKIQEQCANGSYLDVITNLTNNFLTNISLNNLLDIYTSSSEVEGEWEYIRYHLGGEGTYAGTASMGWDRQLYVCKPFSSQLDFVRAQVEKVLNNEPIVYEDLPNNSDTTFMEN